MHLVHGDEIDVERAEMRQHGAQEPRFDFKVAVGLEIAFAPRADVVQHENDADACENWSQQVMRAGEVERFKPGTDHGVAELLHWVR